MATWTFKLQHWYQESVKELGLPNSGVNQDYAIYPKRFYENPILQQDKKIDFSFIGAFWFAGSDQGGQKEGYEARKWVIDFAKKHFTNQSYFANTTLNKGLKEPWETLGSYDKTHEDIEWMVPKMMPADTGRNRFDENYFSVLSQSKFCLCPAGDAPFSMRFYEALMCRAIPIVDRTEVTYRSESESNINYKYYLSGEDSYQYRADWAQQNYDIFMQYHTFKYKNT